MGELPHIHYASNKSGDEPFEFDVRKFKESDNLWGMPLDG